MKMIKMNSTLKKIIAWLVIIIIFTLMFISIHKNWQSIKNYPWKLNIPYLILSSFLCFLVQTVMAYVFQVSLSALGRKISFFLSFKLFYLSQLGKYIPGRIWSFTGLFYLGSRYGIEKKNLAVSSILQIVLNNAAGLYLAFITGLMCYNKKIFLMCLPFIILSPLIFFLISQDRMNSFLNFLGRVIKKKNLNISVHFKYSSLIKMFLVYFINWILLGITIYLFINIFYFIPINKLIYITCIISISWLIAYISLITPGGIGAREGIMSFLLMTLMPVSIAIPVTIFIRIWEIFIDAILIIISLLIRIPINHTTGHINKKKL